jgi:hypothetical protein
MVRVCDVAWAFAVLTLTLAGPNGALADPISLTGNVAADFTTANGSIKSPIDQGPGVIAGPTGSNAGELPAGVFIQNIWLNYNAATDTMYVGIQGYQNVNGKEEIFGDDSGNLNPAQDESPNFTGDKSFAVAFAPVTHSANGSTEAGSGGIIAGIPQDKSNLPTNTIDGFTVAQYNGSSLLASGFGQQLANAGNLAFNPSAAHPDAEFTINNFSKISGINPANGIALQVYAADPTAAPDPVTGTQTEDGPVQTSWIYLPAPQGIHTPEPTTWVAWLLMAGGAGWQYRRRRTARP